MQFERRKRIRIPYTIIIVAAVLLILPIANYLFIKYSYHIRENSIKWFFLTLNPLELLFFFSPVLIAYGLLKVKKWGWWYLLVYSATLILYNLISFILLKDEYHGISLIQTIFSSALAVYFLKKDISAPYLKMYPRGWRGEKRTPLKLRVKIKGIDYVTADASLSGIFVFFPNCPFQLTEEV